ncbi:juvenile hormone esterase-like [Bombus vancouverensis nearcticus]|uniref:Carboxylic ester hydrolase n=1 Tax=Bombus bifarius TaxID=103933 RepID=A0A6P8LCH2_9HYME|nr:esterase B1-like [Bombus vancouverensis nearcticus]XP_033297786.1 esterase B1-like [Bombus bifarius]
MNGANVYLFVLLISSLEYFIISSPRTFVVETPSGPVRGLVLRTVWNSVKYSSFKGIPYAKPPLGDLRFKPPVPKEPWKGVLNAFEEGNMCPQSDYVTSVFSGHEDCLYLNVYTREMIFKGKVRLRPVMVWLYGGGYMSGHCNSSLYGPDFFMEEDVVLVTFNYRLSVLGFLALNHPNATGNAGLKDQQLAFQWVQSNIAAFGGDPEQVTIFGESAGSTSIGFHMLSERSRGLFRRSISMSGTPLCPWAYHTPEQMIHNAYKLAGFLNYVPKSRDDLLNYLRHAPAIKLIRAAEKVDLNILPFRPTIENPDIDPTNSSFLTECPIAKYHNGDFYHHDMMLGYTRNEILLFLGPPIGVANMIDWARKYLQSINTYNEKYTKEPIALFAQIICNFFNTSYNKLEKIAMDILFSGPIDLTQRLITTHNKGHSTYYYRLSYQSKYSWHIVDHNPLNGTAHFDDVGYIFNSNALRAPTNPRHRFNRFRKKMVKLWANFAKYGDPTPKNHSRSHLDVNWTNSGHNGLQLDINTVSTMHKRLIDAKTESFERLYYRVLPLVSSCVNKPIRFLNCV